MYVPPICSGILRTFREASPHTWGEKKGPENKKEERLIRGRTKFDFTVDEGKGRLNPSRDKN